MLYPYDKSYHIPAPVVEVRVSSLEGKEAKCKGLIDPGVEMTCIPEGIIEYLGLTPSSSEHLVIRNVMGRISNMPVYLVDISFSTFNMKNVQVLAFKTEIGLIGRDILNQLTVTLNGKELVFDIE